MQSYNLCISAYSAIYLEINILAFAFSYTRDVVEITQDINLIN